MFRCYALLEKDCNLRTVIITIFNWFTTHKYIILLISKWITIVREKRQLCNNVSGLFLKDNILQFEDSICSSVKKFVAFSFKIP